MGGGTAAAAESAGVDLVRTRLVDAIVMVDLASAACPPSPWPLAACVSSAVS